MVYEITRSILMRLSEYKWIRTIAMYVEACKYLDLRVWDHVGGNRRVFEALMSDKPQAICNIGGFESVALRKCLRYRYDPRRFELLASNCEQLYINAGVFPKNYDTLEKYSQLITNEILPEITHMVVYFGWGEAAFVKKYCRDFIPVRAGSLSAYLWPSPWTLALAGKKVLVVHPFINTILQQYPLRRYIWGHKEILPDFQLDVLRVPLSPALIPPKTQSWFETLEILKEDMTHRCFDVALIGAGAYSLPLVVHAKRLGKKGIHTGGETQFLFGIKGRRWDGTIMYNRFYNEYWIRPLPDETPPNNSIIENGCYW